MGMNLKGDLSDLEDFLGSGALRNYKVDYFQPLEIQGFMDSMEVMQYIIYLESKYSVRLTRDEIRSISVYKDLLDILEDK